jgi:hypothetical protein
MSYGYIEGTESASLSYFEALLAQTADINERQKIEAIIKDLREAIEKRPRPVVQQDGASIFNLSVG